MSVFSYWQLWLQFPAFYQLAEMFPTKCILDAYSYICNLSPYFWDYPALCLSFKINATLIFPLFFKNSSQLSTVTCWMFQPFNLHTDLDCLNKSRLCRNMFIEYIFKAFAAKMKDLWFIHDTAFFSLYFLHLYSCYKFISSVGCTFFFHTLFLYINIHFLFSLIKIISENCRKLLHHNFNRWLNT